MSHQIYTIYFNGKIADNFSPIEVKKRAQTIFKLSEERVHILFDGSAHVLKKNLSQQECEQFLKKLLNIGLIANSTPPLPSLATVKSGATPINKTQNPVLSKLLLASITLLIVGITAGWLSGFINFGKLSEPANTPLVQTQPNDIVEESTSTPSLQAQSTDIIDESINIPALQAPTTHLNPIEECTSGAVTNLLERILIQGIPQLIQNSSPSIQLTMQDYSYNQEVYFDPHRNKRLCGVLAQYKVNNSDTQNTAQDSSVIYEIIYEIEKEEDQSIKLSTFRQRVVSPNLSDNNAVNTQDVEQN